MLSAEVTRLMDALEGGSRPSAVQITLLSDFGRAETAELADRWERVSPDLRQEVIERAAALAEDNVDLDFKGLIHVALGDEAAGVRRAAAEASWELRDRETARHLSTLVSSDRDESVRAAAATALEPLVLATELGEFDEAEGDAVVEALRNAVERRDESADVRARALESLGSRTLPWVSTLINDAYYSEDGRLRIAAIRAMGESAQESWIEYLEETATAEDPEMRYETAAALGAIGSDAGVEVLADLLDDEDTEVVNEAVMALGLIGGEDALEHLVRLAEYAEGALAEAVDAAIEAARYADSQPDLLRSRIGL
jgi:HEAT repeat protein